LLVFVQFTSLLLNFASLLLKLALLIGLSLLLTLELIPNERSSRSACRAADCRARAWRANC
jgi:hypothetical protein